MTTTPHTADDFAALSGHLREKFRAAAVPSTEIVPHGCGPGIGVPADIPQEGVRSVLSRDVIALDQELRTLICRLHIHPRVTAQDYQDIGRMAQKIADRAHLLSGKVNI